MPLPSNYLKARAEKVEAVGKPPQKIRVDNKELVSDVYIAGEIGPWGVSYSSFVDAFNSATSDSVNIRINSVGGDVFDGLGIYSTIKDSDKEVTVYVDGLAASAASFIAMAGDKIVMGRNARMMIHDAGTMIFGNEQDLLETAQWLSEESDNIADIYAQRAGGTQEEWRQKMRNETWYSSDAAMAAGLTDEVSGKSTKDAATKKVSNKAETVPTVELVEEVTVKFDPEAFRLAFQEAFSD